MSRLAIELRPGEGGDDAFAFCQELKTAVLAYARRRDDEAHAVAGSPGSSTLVVDVDGDWRAHGTGEVWRLADFYRGRIESSDAA